MSFWLFSGIYLIIRAMLRPVNTMLVAETVLVECIYRACSRKWLTVSMFQIQMDGIYWIFWFCHCFILCWAGQRWSGLVGGSGWGQHCQHPDLGTCNVYLFQGLDIAPLLYLPKNQLLQLQFNRLTSLKRFEFAAPPRHTPDMVTNTFYFHDLLRLQNSVSFCRNTFLIILGRLISIQAEGWSVWRRFWTCVHMLELFCGPLKLHLVWRLGDYPAFLLLNIRSNGDHRGLRKIKHLHEKNR